MANEKLERLFQTFSLDDKASVRELLREFSRQGVILTTPFLYFAIRHPVHGQWYWPGNSNGWSPRWSPRPYMFSTKQDAEKISETLQEPVDVVELQPMIISSERTKPDPQRDTPEIPLQWRASEHTREIQTSFKASAFSGSTQVLLEEGEDPDLLVDLTIDELQDNLRAGCGAAAVQPDIPELDFSAE